MKHTRHYSTSSSSSSDSDEVLDDDRKKYWNRTHTIGDGVMKLGYAIFGAVKDYRYTVVYFHGTPGSRLEAAELHKPAKKLNIRILAFDRPGYGLSTDYRLRKIEDFGYMISDTLQDLYRNRPVYLLGYSNGAAYALATASILRERHVKGVCIVAGFPPWDIAEQEIPPSALQLIRRAKLFPSFLAPSASLARRVSTYFHGSIGAASTAAERPKAILQDVRLLTGSWWPDMSRLERYKIKMFYSKDDRVVTVKAGRRFAKQLQNATLKVVKGDHNSIMERNGDDILRQLIGKRSGRSRRNSRRK